MRSLRLIILLAACLLLGLAGGCNGTLPPEEKRGEGKIPSDGGDAETSPEQTSSLPWPPPKGYAAVTFTVDDSANGTYQNKQLLWTGSFAYNSRNNTIVYASSWLPTDGPFPPLYDDGPIDKGGHEPIGAKAKDHIFGAVVFVRPDPKEDLEFEYGVINEDNNWIWEGTNGRFIVSKGSTRAIKAKGLTIPKHGDIDLKITLNAKELPAEFALPDPSTPIFLKGTMNSWAYIQILDKGKFGDEQAGDKIYTYVQRHVLSQSPHFGLLQRERHVQFVFQFTSIHGREYKDADDKAIANGVTVWADCDKDGKFSDDEEQRIIWEKDSRGAAINTTVILCAPPPPCTKDLDCNPDEICNKTKGICEPKPPACTQADCHKPECQNHPVCLCSNDADCKPNETCNTTTGKCEPKKGCTQDSECKPDEVCHKATGKCEPKPCTQADCQLPRCKNDPICKVIHDPRISLLRPNKGPLAGGTEVTLEGEYFQQGAKVTFGAKDATTLKFVSEKEITCKTPPGDKVGAVDVVLTNPNGRSVRVTGGFAYEKPVLPAPQISKITPARGDVGGGEAFTLTGQHLQQGARVSFDGIAATGVQVASATTLHGKTPAHVTATVDVTVTNPDGQSATLKQGFAYYEKNPQADQLWLVRPLTLSGNTGASLGPVYCQVFDRVLQTKGSGQAQGIKVQLGWGTASTQARTWPAAQWKDATYLQDAGDNDEYKGSLTFAKVGTYHYACRASVDGGQSWVYGDGDKDGSKNGYDPQKAGVATVTKATVLSLGSLSPSSGPQGGGSVVTLQGSGFATGLVVSFGGKAATKVTIQSATKAKATPPAATQAGKVDVLVTLGAQKDTLSKGFTYTGVGTTIGWCKLQWPQKIPDASKGIPPVSAGKASSEIYGWVYKAGVTNKAGKGAGLLGEIGYGPTGTDPSKDPRWAWFPATYNGDKDGLAKNDNDEYMGQLFPTTQGSFDYAYRFSDDGGIHFWYCDTTGNNRPSQPYNTTKAGKLTVQ